MILTNEIDLQKNKYDIIIVGCGLSGIVSARQLAEKGKKVLIIDKRDHIGGNVYDYKIENLTTHKYGPHIFHTNNEKVFEYISRFTKLNDFKNVVSGLVEDKVVPIPFNFEGIDAFWPDKKEEIKAKLINKYGMDKRIFIEELRKSDDELLKQIGEFVFKNVFVNYSVKMWGVPIEKLDPEVIKRVPFVIGYDKRYFSDKYEGLPINGYTDFVKSIIDHENIDIKLNVFAKEVLSFDGDNIRFCNSKYDGQVIYTGPIDEMLEYKFGVLNYRSLKIVQEIQAVDSFQETAVVNYPAHPTMTRITEYKKMTLEVDKNKTILSREYPGKFEINSKEFNERYYPLMTDEGKKAYDQYFIEAKKIKNLHLLGRLATYKYINMDQAILNALDLVEKMEFNE